MNTISQDSTTHDEIQLLKIKHRAELVGLSVKTLSKIHRRTERRIYDALSDKAPQLLSKILRTIERYEISQQK